MNIYTDKNGNRYHAAKITYHIKEADINKVADVLGISDQRAKKLILDGYLRNPGYADDCGICLDIALGEIVSCEEKRADMISKFIDLECPDRQ